MKSETEQLYLESIKPRFVYYRELGEKAIAQLEPEQLFYTFNEESNSIATIIRHLHGNMLSRWTDFLTTDGEKNWRNRDSEFENPSETKEELMAKWHAGWDCFLSALNQLQPGDLTKTIYIRSEAHTVLDAINRQLAHYPYHVGQIVFLAKMLKKSPWISLSIPKNKSEEFNKEKFSQEK